MEVTVPPMKSISKGERRHGARALSRDERGHAQEIFGDSVDLDAVSIHRGSLLSIGAACVTGNRINLQPRHFQRETMELSDCGWRVLIHELTHVWQYQNGGLAYVRSSLVAQCFAFARRGRRSAAYDWRAMVNAGVPWVRWNAEQQAEAMGDYAAARHRLKSFAATREDGRTVALLLPYVQLVRSRFGAPGSRRR